MKARVVLLLFLYCGLCSLADQTPEARFATAEAAFQNQDYASALRIYRELLDQGFRSAALFYNLGTTAFKSGNIGMAEAYLLIASYYAPGNQDIRNNLQVVRARTRDRFELKNTFPLQQLYQRLMRRWTMRTWSLIVLGLLTLFSLSLSVSLFLRLAWLRITAWCILCLTLVLLPFWYGAYSHYLHPDQAVVIRDNTQLKNGPGDQMVTLTELHPGTQITVSQAQDGFVRVMLPNGLVGWVYAENIFTIKPHMLGVGP